MRGLKVGIRFWRVVIVLGLTLDYNIIDCVDVGLAFLMSRAAATPAGLQTAFYVVPESITIENEDGGATERPVEHG